MAILGERQVLSELLKLFKKPPVETELPLILPLGGIGYAVDSADHVVGLKIILDHDVVYPGAQELLLELVRQFRHLKRLVIYTELDIAIPQTIGELEDLKFLWLAGNIKRLPSEVLHLNLPIIVNSDPNQSVDNIRPLVEEFIEIARKRVGPGKNLGRDDEAVFIELIKLVTRKAFQRKDVHSEEPLYDEEDSFTIAQVRQLVERSLRLTGIFLNNVTLEDPPLEIAAKGSEAVARYFRERRTGDLPLNEVKVILVGNGSSGKTSLVKRVFGEAFNSNEPQTHGINILPWTLKVDEGNEIKANFWDFGGQEIMHATHQFFLSKRSLYILVLDGRKEEDAEYWLQHIESFGGESPTIVVLNKIDENSAFDVNRRFLRNKYKGIIDFFRVSCATGTGIADFATRLQEELAKVPILQTLWPRNWFRVKQRLENLETAYISLTEYNALCREENVQDQASQEILVDFLHDLGIILHFRDLKLLDTHVLDPRWVTEAVYRIINSELLAKQKGVLDLGQLSDVLKPPEGATIVYPPDKHRYIIELMLKFELCYELGGNAVLVPDLLDIQQPEIILDYDNALRFMFEYTYLPKSIMPRFIVRMHRDIKGNQRWRTGVVLQDKYFGATAIVTTDEKAKRTYVFVSGEQKRDYFAAIRKIINDINGSFEKLGVTEFVPLPDAPDVLLDYRELIGYELGERDEIFVGRLGRAYQVQALLNGIEEKSVRRRKYSQTTIHVQGDYYAHSTVGRADHGVVDQRWSEGGNRELNYQPSGWEKAITYATGLLFIGVISFLLIRNQPIADPNLVVLVRILLSLIVAVFGATVPGMLKVDLKNKGIAIRATGALALFVLTFLLTPTVLSGDAR
jgi:internalin A